MDPSLVKGKKFKKEEAGLSPSTSADCHDSDPERNYKLEAEEEASTSPPPLLRNIRVQVRSLTISTVYLQLSTTYLHDISTISPVLLRTRLWLGRRRCCTTAPRC